MLKNIFSGLLKIAGFCLLLSFVTTGCKPDDNGIGIDIIDSDIFVPYRDTLYVTAVTAVQDSTSSSGFSDNETYPVGCMFDPMFGKTSSSLAVTFGLTSENPEFSKATGVDSVVLSMAYSGNIYGDKLCPQTFRVYELNEKLEGTYFSNYRCRHSAVELGSRTFMPSLDSVYVDGGLIAPVLRIKLDNSLGERIITADSSYLASDTAFIDLLNGIYITPDVVNTPGSGALVHFYLEDDLTFIKIYYHNDTTGGLSYRLNVTEDLVRYLEYDHFDYQDASPEIRTAVNDTARGEEKLYVQSLSGLFANIFIEGIDSIAAKGTIAVSNAVLSFHVDPSSYYISMPTEYELVRIKSDGTTATVPDAYLNASYYGGTYNSETGIVSFRVSSLMQEYFYGTIENYGLYLVVKYASYTPARVALYGSNPSDPTKRIMLDMTYSVVLQD